MPTQERARRRAALDVVVVTTGVSPIVAPLLRSRHRIRAFVESVPPASVRDQRRAYDAAARIWSALRGRESTLGGVARRRGLPCFALSRDTVPQLAPWLRDLRPDVLVVYMLSVLLEPDVLAIPRLGAINLHPSYLPEYRGAMPWFWIFYDMEPRGGVTVHFIDPGEDTGDVIFQERFPIAPGARLADLMSSVDEIGPRLLVRALDALADGNCPRVPQPRASPTRRARAPRPEQRAGLIEWRTWPIERVWHLLRGCEGRLRLIDPPPGWRRPLRWRIGEWVKEPASCEAGTIGRDAVGWFVAHTQGKIRLEVDYDWKTLAKGLLARLR